MLDSILFCIATAVYFEARDQSIEGQLAVSNTIENRVQSSLFPANHCEVVTQGPVANGWPQRHQCQFSFYCDGKSDIPVDKAAFNKAISVAVVHLSGIIPDNTDGALWYHADYVDPWWAVHMQYIKSIGVHIFYKEQE